MSQNHPSPKVLTACVSAASFTVTCYKQSYPSRRPRISKNPNRYHSSCEQAHEAGEDDFWVYDDDSDSQEEEGWVYYDEVKEAQEEAARPEFVKVDEGLEVINEKEKLLIFTTGNEWNIPHQVGIKRQAI